NLARDPCRCQTWHCRPSERFRELLNVCVDCSCLRELGLTHSSLDIINNCWWGILQFFIPESGTNAPPPRLFTPIGTAFVLYVAVDRAWAPKSSPRLHQGRIRSPVDLKHCAADAVGMRRQ